ncbi:MAG: hypothetical protein ABEK16_05170 [Candidatus Nanohalobium sp.]
MAEDYKQRHVDELAKQLRNHAGLYCDWFKVAHGLDQDPERIEAYVDSNLNYKDLEPMLEDLLERAEEKLPESLNYRSNRDEQLYRFFRRKGEVPEMGEGTWRDLHSEAEVIENEREDREAVDYRPLIRSVIDVRTFAMAASEYDEEIERLVPETDGDDAEIIEHTEKIQDNEVRPAAVSSHLHEENQFAEDSDDFTTAIHAHFGFINSDETEI